MKPIHVICIKLIDWSLMSITGEMMLLLKM